MSGNAVREFLRPQDRLELNFDESFASHCVALDTRTGELLVAVIERTNQIVADWRQRPAQLGAAVTLNIYLLGQDQARGALEDPQIIARLDACEPLLFAVESEEDAELIAEGLRWRLARMNASHGRH